MSEIGENTPQPMPRLSLTADDQTAIDQWRTSNGVQPSDVVVVGTNLKVDDHLEIDNSWKVVVLSGDGGGAVQSYIPEWGGLILAIDLVDYVTNRGGPNGEAMPIVDEMQMQARLAAKQNPNEAAKDQRDRRRGLTRALREAVQRLDGDDRKRAKKALQERGLLDGNDDK